VAANDTDSPPTHFSGVLTNMRLPRTRVSTTLVLDEVLDAESCRAMQRFQKHARLAPRCDAAIDLRRTRATASLPWAMLVKIVRDLKYNGHSVTVLAGESLTGLLEVTGLSRHARIIFPHAANSQLP
jgi:hypothetical protein